MGNSVIFKENYENESRIVRIFLFTIILFCVMMVTHFFRGVRSMRKTNLRSFVLLFIFFSFLITQYPGGHVTSLSDQEQHAVISSDPMEVFLLKDDFKKASPGEHVSSTELAFLINTQFPQNPLAAAQAV